MYSAESVTRTSSGPICTTVFVFEYCPHSSYHQCLCCNYCPHSSYHQCLCCNYWPHSINHHCVCVLCLLSKFPLTTLQLRFLRYSHTMPQMCVHVYKHYIPLQQYKEHLPPPYSKCMCISFQPLTSCLICHRTRLEHGLIAVSPGRVNTFE